jgi:hypothetical protein
MKKILLTISLLFTVIVTLLVNLSPLKAETVEYSYTYEYECENYIHIPVGYEGSRYCFNTFVGYDEPWSISIDLDAGVNKLLSKDSYVSTEESTDYYDWVLKLDFQYSTKTYDANFFYEGYESIASISTLNITEGYDTLTVEHYFDNTVLPSTTDLTYYISKYSGSDSNTIDLKSISLKMVGAYETIPDEPDYNENPINSDPVSPEPEEPTETPDMYSFKESISFSDITITDESETIINENNLLLDNEYTYDIQLINSINNLKNQDVYVLDNKPTEYYEWYFEVLFRIPDDSYKYDTNINGFSNLFDTLSTSPNFDEINHDLTTVYFELRKDPETQVMTNFAKVGSNLGYTAIPDSISFNSFFSAIEAVRSSTYELAYVNLTMTGYNVPKENVASDYELVTSELRPDLPISTDRIEALDETSNSWRIHFSVASKEFSYDTTIPNEIYSYEEIASMALSQFYTLKIVTYNSETSLAESKLLLLINSEISDVEPMVLNDLGYPNPRELERYSALNLTDKTYVHTKSITINGIVNKESNYNAYLYTSIPIDYDELLSIRLSYKYRYNYVFKTGDWNTIENVYQKDQTNDTAPPRWIWWLTLPGYTIPYEILNQKTDIYNINQISNVLNPDQEIVDLFSEKLNFSPESLAETSISKIHLGQYRDTFSTGYDIDNVVVMNLTYADNGLVYEVPYSLIESNVFEPEEEGSTIDKIKDGLDSSDGDSWLDGLPDFNLIPDSIQNGFKVILIMISTVLLLLLIKNITKFIKAFK